MGLFDTINPGGSGYGDASTSSLRSFLSTRMLKQPRPSMPPPEQQYAPPPAIDPITRTSEQPSMGSSFAGGSVFRHGVGGPSVDPAAFQDLLARIGIQAGPPRAGQAPGSPIGHVPFAWRILRALQVAGGGGAQGDGGPAANWTAGNTARTGRLESGA